jgi:thiamine biosynthesis protein ThiI
MKEIILIKYGEMALKGLNKRTFEDVLVKNIKRRIKSLGKTEITRAQSTICITPLEENYDAAEAVERLSKVLVLEKT